MNLIVDCRASLQEAGFSAEEADRIVRWKTARNRANTQQPGKIVMEKTGEGEAELLIYEAIGFDFWTGGGLTPKKLTDDLAAFGKLDKLTLRVNSPGGDVFDAVTMFNILRRQEAKIAVEIEGLAASAASFLVQAADPGELHISEAGMMMVHQALGVVMGNKNDMADMAAVLEKLDGQIAAIYANRSKRKSDTWMKIMEEESWFTGQEAVDAKLADAVIPAKRVAACVDPEVFNQFRATPERLVAQARAAREQQDAEDAKRREAEAVNVRMRLIELEAAG